MRYILFAKKTCPYCIMAQDLLQERGEDYSVVDFEPGQEGVLTEIKKAHEWSTVPMVFSRDGQDIKFIGGYSDLLKLFEDE